MRRGIAIEDFQTYKHKTQEDLVRWVMDHDKAAYDRLWKRGLSMSLYKPGDPKSLFACKTIWAKRKEREKREKEGISQ